MGQTRVYSGNQVVVLPFEEATGAQLKQQLNIPQERIVTVVENGQTRAIGDGESVRLQDGTYLSDAPRYRYGSSSHVEVVLSEVDLASLRGHLLRERNLEQHAFLLAGICQSPRGMRLLVRDMIFAQPQDFIAQTGSYLELQPGYFLPVLDRCRAEGLHLIETHSHPFVGKNVTFSDLDVGNEREKFSWYAEKMPDTRVATLVFGTGSVDGHWYDAKADAIRPIAQVRVVGRSVEVLPATSARQGTPGVSTHSDIFHRQELAFGHAGQELIRKARVAIIGCGGLGSVLVEQLAYLGVREFVLVDHDVVEATNLNRLALSRPEDAHCHRPKVEVLARGIREIQPEAEVETVCASILERSAQERVKDVDLLIAGADSDGARLVTNQLAVQYLVPYIDLGTGINARDGRIEEAGGQLFLVHPGGFCLQCAGAIDPYRARVDLMDEVERGRHIARGYGIDTPQPSVIFLNATLASLAVGEIVKLLTGFREPQAMVLYDALKPSVQAILPPKPAPDCPVCHRGARYARGDEPERPAALYRPVPFVDLTHVKEPADAI